MKPEHRPLNTEHPHLPYFYQSLRFLSMFALLAGGGGALADQAVALSGRTSLAASGRVVWEAGAALDLRRAAGIQCQVRITPAGAAERGLIYVHSGAGWYGAAFGVAGNGDWQTVTILKTATFLEGQPAGWARTTGFRVAVLPAAGAAPHLEVRNWRLLSPTLDGVFMVRGSSAIGRLGPMEARGIVDFPERFGKALGGVGATVALVEDSELAGLLASSAPPTVVILPYNPMMPEPLARSLAAWQARGGGILGFFTPPPALATGLGLRVNGPLPATQVPGGIAAIHVRPGALARAPERTPQASWIIQRLAPANNQARVIATWLNQTGADTGYPALLAGPRWLWMSHVYLNAEPDSGTRLLLAMLGQLDPRVWPATARAAAALADSAAGLDTAQRQAVRQAASGGDGARAVAALQSAGATRQRQAVANLPACSGEFRGAWCHRGYGIRGWTWEHTASSLKACGFNAIFVNFAWAGKSYYPSRLLPADPVVAAQGDQVRAAAAACARNGLELHFWKCCFNLGDSPGAAFAAAARREGRLQVSDKGVVNPRWLCPTNPTNRRLEVESLREAVLNYPQLKGIHLDFIRYPDSHHCFCPTCRRQFEAGLGRRVTNWPGDVLTQPALKARWLTCRRQAITSLVREIHDQLKRERPALVLSAAVWADFASSRDSIGQDAAGWSRAGLVELLAPMTYTADDNEFAGLLRKQRQECAGGRARICPGLGVRTCGLNALQTARQISLNRQAGNPGFLIFEYNLDEANGVFRDLAPGLTRR